jgi:hypothetical protein
VYSARTTENCLTTGDLKYKLKTVSVINLNSVHLLMCWTTAIKADYSQAQNNNNNKSYVNITVT